MLIEVLGEDLHIDDEICDLFKGYGFKLRFMKEEEAKRLVFELPEVAMEIPLFTRGLQAEYTILKELEKFFDKNKKVKEIRLVHDKYCSDYIAIARYVDDEFELSAFLLNGVKYKPNEELPIKALFKNRSDKKKKLSFSVNKFFVVRLYRVDFSELFYFRGQDMEDKEFILELDPQEEISETIPAKVLMEEPGVYKVVLETVFFKEGEAERKVITPPVEITVT